mgnify:CR=1 FL=1
MDKTAIPSQITEQCGGMFDAVKSETAKNYSYNMKDNQGNIDQRETIPNKQYNTKQKYFLSIPIKWREIHNHEISISKAITYST